MQIPTISYKLKLSLWIALSIALYGLGANLAWHYRRPRAGRLGRWVQRVKGWTYTPWLLQALRFSFYLGIPYLALVRGVALPSLMGLTNLDWLGGIWWGTSLGLGGFLLLGFIWRYHLRSLTGWPLRMKPRLDPPLDWPELLRKAIYQEVHWAFYRSGPILLLDDYYFGVFLGFALVNLEWWADPAWRSLLAQAGKAEGILMELSIAFVMALIYLFVRNLWLVVPIHFGLSWGLLRLLQTQAALPDQEGQGDEQGQHGSGHNG